MRRADEDTDAVGRAGAHFRRVGVVIFAIGLATTAVPAARGGEPERAGAPRVGHRVVSRFGELALRDDRDAIAGVGSKDQVYRVERVVGRRIWLRAEGKDLGGWASADEVAAIVEPPVDPTVRRTDARPPRGFGSVLGKSVHHAESHARLRHAEAAVGRRDYPRAIAECTAAIRLDPRNAEAYDLRGGTWAAMNRLDQALIDFDQALRIAPHRPATLAARGEVWLGLKEYGKAIADLDEAIRHGYRDAMAYLDRGKARSDRGESDPALADLDEAIRRDPRLGAAYVERAVIRGRKGEYDRAIADLDEAIRLDPRNGPAYGGLARLRATCPDEKYRDGRAAVAAATRAGELDGWKDADDLGTLGAACAEAGDFEAAVKWQTRAIALYSNDKDRAEGAARLKLYRAGTPYRAMRP